MMTFNKSPGNDGLTKEFYIAFWKKISKPLLDYYKYSQDVKSLSNSQRQAIITLLEKPGKDRSYLRNWRPISLLNLDYKLLTKVLGSRVKNVLPSIISDCQTGYVLNKSINDSVRIVQDIINYTEITQSQGFLLAVDFHKAFDSIEWNFIMLALKSTISVLCSSIGLILFIMISVVVYITMERQANTLAYIVGLGRGILCRLTCSLLLRIF